METAIPSPPSLLFARQLGSIHHGNEHMKSKLLAVCIVLLGCTHAAEAQRVREVSRPGESLETSSRYLSLMDELDALRDRNGGEAIRLLEEAYPALRNPIEQFDLIFRELLPRYAANGRFEECLGILRAGQDQGLFFPIGLGDQLRPEFIDELTNLDGFGDFFQENERRVTSARESAATEYYVQLPANYSSGNTYPLLLILHGSWGHIPSLVEEWQSPVLHSDYIVAYVQGIRMRGPYTRSFAGRDLSNIVEAFREITEKYPVDMSRIIIGGQSAGGSRAESLAFEELIPARGLILAFPGMSEFSDEAVQRAAERGMRVSILAGENDRGIQRQKAMAVRFDQHGLPNRFIVSSETGHWFPKDFPRQLDLSLEYIFREYE
jgi:predicted esterase